MRKVFEIGGLVAGVVLIAFGVAAIAMGFNGRSTVGNVAPRRSRSSAHPT